MLVHLAVARPRNLRYSKLKRKMKVCFSKYQTGRKYNELNVGQSQSWVRLVGKKYTVQTGENSA